MKRRVYLPAMLISILAIFLAANQLSTLWLGGARLDLTESGLYRLSPGSRAVITRLGEPVEWRFYYSRADAAQYPAIRSYAGRVREFLRTYADAAGGRIRLTEIDPVAFSAEEDAALEAGVMPLPAEGGERLFFGLVASNSVDRQAVIPVFAEQDEARLEYDLTRLLSDLERDERPRLAILTGLPLSPDDGAPNAFVSELASRYELIWVDPGFEDLPEASALLIMHPRSLTEGQLYRIDQHVLNRGRVLAFLDPMAHMALRPGPDGLPLLNASRQSDLGMLTARWGVAWDSQAVAMDRTLGLPVEIVDPDGRSRRRAYPLWFSAGPDEMNREDPATSGLDRGVNFGSPGAFFSVGLDGVAFLPLLSTSRDGALLDADIAAGAPGPDDLLRDYEPAPAPLVLAARLSGVFETAFPEGPPVGDIQFDPSQHIDIAPAPVDITIVADIDWLDDGYYMRSDPQLGTSLVADNLSLALNLIDMAVGERELIGLRSRAPSSRSMTRVDALRAEAEIRYLEIQDSLEADIADAETRLAALRESGAASGLLPQSNAQARREAAALRQQIGQARTRLRDIEREFRRDIDALDANLQFWTIGVPPFLVILAGIAGGLVRRRRRG